jgi:hypothetical protein
MTSGAVHAARAEPGVLHPVAIVAQTNGANNGDPAGYLENKEGGAVLPGLAERA